MAQRKGGKVPVTTNDRKSQSKSARTRLRILDAAARTFHEKGYAATRLSDIAEAANTQAGSLYYHFDSKEHLLSEVLERGHARVFETVRKLVEDLGSTASYRDRLRVAIRAHLENNHEHDDYAAANIHLHNQIPENIRQHHIQKHRAYAAYWQELLSDAQTADEIRADVDVSMLRLNLFGMMNWSIEWYRPGRLNIEELADNMCATLFAGIGSPAKTVTRSNIPFNKTLPADTNTLVQALSDGNIRTCARLISRIERNDREMVPLLQALYRIGGRAQIIGITGPPGAGKSTLVSRLIEIWRQRDLSVAILAIDPSSPLSGGAVLGDRMRMMEHSCDDKVFIRSMASRGELGGLAKAAGDALTVLEAMSWDIILVETVGVGQNETDIMRYASVSVLLQTPMGGDEVQAKKAGITEIADIFVVNKSDHPEADRTARQLNDMIMLGMGLNPERSWQPPVIKTQALTGDGAAELADQIDLCFVHLASDPKTRQQKMRGQAQHRIGKIVHDMLEQRLMSDEDLWLEDSVDPVLERDSDPYALAASLLARLEN
jgi:LAO/AO transport system kinase